MYGVFLFCVSSHSFEGIWLKKTNQNTQKVKQNAFSLFKSRQNANLRESSSWGMFFSRTPAVNSVSDLKQTNKQKTASEVCSHSSLMHPLWLYIIYIHIYRMGQLKFSHFSGCDFTKQGLPYTDLFTICVTELDDNKDIFFYPYCVLFLFLSFWGEVFIFHSHVSLLFD